MSSINSVRNLQILNFSKKNKWIKKLKKDEEKWAGSSIYTYYFSCAAFHKWECFVPGILLLNT